ncbi:MAG TPA: alpha-L-fucosidase, partial [Fimbriimonadaceae bacterium]|nr:alpha-L-fucosidase [Fimbriimonadaceae bacterium]
SQACRQEGLKFGVYLSPWDRNHPDYGTPKYNQVFESMLHEVLTHYGPVFEVWFDGANGEGPNGKKQVYDWPAFIKVVRECQPNAVIFSDAGPDIRWTGNEAGYAGETNWDMIDKSKFSPGHADQAILNSGLENGPDWVPAECDVSIRPGWFWRASEDSKVKTVEQLLDIWYGSVGRGSNLILNVPPNSDGLISEGDAQRLREFNNALEKDFAHEVPIASADELVANGSQLQPVDSLVDPEGGSIWYAKANQAVLKFTFSNDSTVDRIVLEEPVEMGQRIAKFKVFTDDLQNGRKTIAEGTTVGVRRILRIPAVKARELWIEIDDARATPALSRVAFFNSAG